VKFYSTLHLLSIVDKPQQQRLFKQSKAETTMTRVAASTRVFE